MSGWTLEEAIALGRGTERPFRCHVHGDTNASASVNVVKMVWVCYACQASGAVDSNRVPTHDELLAMLEPEKAAREYQASWLDTFGVGGYWAERFPRWVCEVNQMGEDPWFADATFPVHTPRGRLAGVGRRLAVPGPGPKYKYPAHWSASRTLFGSRGVWKPTEVLCLVEGAADQSAVLETGVHAFGTYGSGLHMPQVELIAQMSPKLVLLGFDMDEAGERAVHQAAERLTPFCETAEVEWDHKDPADTPLGERRENLFRAVRGTAYGDVQRVMEQAEARVRTLTAYVEEALSG